MKTKLKLKLTDLADGWLVENSDNPEQQYQEETKMLEPTIAIGHFVHQYAKELGIELDIITRYELPLLTAKEYGVQRIPEVGDKIYIGSGQKKTNHGLEFMDPDGGLATVSALYHWELTKWNGNPVLMVEVKEQEGYGINWAAYEPIQNELESTYGGRIATCPPPIYMVSHPV